MAVANIRLHVTRTSVGAFVCIACWRARVQDTRCGRGGKSASAARRSIAHLFDVNFREVEGFVGG
jgi:hypothetical protein